MVSVQMEREGCWLLIMATSESKYSHHKVSSSSPLDVLSNPWDVAVDPEGNIHAALCSNHHIAIYSEDGNLIDTYNLGGRLQCPKQYTSMVRATGL